ncbi:MAG: hypothetical protein LBQ28_02155 [Prevotellaceae bacterium]|jgi:hypothetical protein|nr:hypothetical protein [Prevotellaceae bacterium]
MNKILKKSIKIYCIILIFLIVIFSIVEIFSGFENMGTKNKINAFLEARGMQTIEGGSKEEIESQLFSVLKDHITRVFGEYENDTLLSSIADLIVETGCYGTAKRMKGYGILRLLFWITIKADAVLEKTPENEEFLKWFYRTAEDTNHSEFGNLAFFKLYEENPNMLNKFYPEQTAYQEEGSLENALTKSSKEFKNFIIKQTVTAGYEKRKTKAFPVSMIKSILADFKPSAPEKGGYLFVFDDSEHKLPDNSGESYTTNTNRTYTDRYETYILHPVLNPDNAQIIIYETYSYAGPRIYNHQHGGISAYLCHTNVRVVNAATGKTIFNKTYRSDWDFIYSVSENSDYFIDNDYNYAESEKFAKQISELVEKGL